MISLRKLAKAHNLRQRELAEILKTDQSVVSLVVNGHRKLNEDQIELLRARFGDEELVKYDVPEEVRHTTADLTFYSPELVDEVREELREEMRNNPKQEGLEVIEPEEVELKTTPILTPDIVNLPNVDIKAGLEDGTLPVQTKLTQDIIPDGVVKVYLENDEMAPDIEANDPVLIRLMDKKDAIVHGRMYFVDLYRGAVVRWVFPQSDGTLLLRSKNAPDMVVQMDSVMSISEVVTIWKRPKCLPNDHISMFEELRRRDDQMDELLAQQGRLIGIIEKHN